MDGPLNTSAPAVSRARPPLALAPLLLRWRLLAMRAGPLACGVTLLWIIGVAAWAWVLPQRARLQQLELAQRAASAPPAVAAPAVLAAAAPLPSSAHNLALFYATLGERRYAEQQVKTLFDLAAKTGLSLEQGEYRAGYDKASHVSTYQVVLPVKGSYAAIWRFVLLALENIPFASLDEINFKRENIGETVLEARLRLTFYLKDSAMQVTP